MFYRFFLIFQKFVVKPYKFNVYKSCVLIFNILTVNLKACKVFAAFMCFMPLNCHVSLKFQNKKVIKEPKMTYFIVFVTDLLFAGSNFRPYFYFL